MTNRVQFDLGVFLHNAHWSVISAAHPAVYTGMEKCLLYVQKCVVSLLWYTTHLLNDLLRQTHRTNPPNCVTGTNAIWEVMGPGCRFTCEHFARVVELVSELFTEQHRRMFVLTRRLAERSSDVSFCQVETDKLGWLTTPFSVCPCGWCTDDMHERLMWCYYGLDYETSHRVSYFWCLARGQTDCMVDNVFSITLGLKRSCVASIFSLLWWDTICATL